MKSIQPNQIKKNLTTYFHCRSRKTKICNMMSQISKDIHINLNKKYYPWKNSYKKVRSSISGFNKTKKLQQKHKHSIFQNWPVTCKP